MSVSPVFTSQSFIGSPPASKRRKFPENEEKAPDSSSSSSRAPSIVNSDAMALSARAETPEVSFPFNVEALVSCIQIAREEEPHTSARTLAGVLSAAQCFDGFKEFPLSTIAQSIALYAETAGLRDRDLIWIQRVVKFIYLDGLANSQMKYIAPELEQKIGAMREEISEQNISTLIARTDVILHTENPSKMDKQENYQLIVKLLRFINYTFYIDPLQRESISLLAQEAKSYESFYLYPRLYNEFLPFCEEMKSRCQTLNAKELLILLNKKKQEWDLLEGPIPSFQLAPESVVLEKYYADSLWKAGLSIIKRGFEKELNDRFRKRNVRLPQALCNAVVAAMREQQSWGTFNTFLTNERLRQRLMGTDPFFHALWSHYLFEREFLTFDVSSLALFLLKNHTLQALQNIRRDLQVLDRENSPFQADKKVALVRDACLLSLPRHYTLSSLKKNCFERIGQRKRLLEG